MLKSSVIEMNEKLLNVDKCLSGLTNLVTALIKASSNPMTKEASLLLQSIGNICGKKREAIFIDSPAMDLKRVRSLGVASHDDGDFPYYDRCCTDESDDTNSTSTEIVRDCKVNIMPSEFHTDNDFDKFLAYIADDEQPLNYETSGPGPGPGSDPGMVPIEYMLASAYPSVEKVHNTEVPPALCTPRYIDSCAHSSSSSKCRPFSCSSQPNPLHALRHRSSENILLK